MKPIITTNDIQDMVSHWLSTPPYGYLGSDYGSDKESLVQNPEGTGVTDDFFAKMRTDVPIITVMPSGTVRLIVTDTAPDKQTLQIDIAGQQVTVG